MKEESEIRLFDKIDELHKIAAETNIQMAKMPCKVHKEKFDSVNGKIKRIWAVIFLILSGILSIGFATLKGG